MLLFSLHKDQCVPASRVNERERERGENIVSLMQSSLPPVLGVFFPRKLSHSMDRESARTERERKNTLTSTQCFLRLFHEGHLRRMLSGRSLCVWKSLVQYEMKREENIQLSGGKAATGSGCSISGATVNACECECECECDCDCVHLVYDSPALCQWNVVARVYLLLRVEERKRKRSKTNTLMSLYTVTLHAQLCNKIFRPPRKERGRYFLLYVRSRCSHHFTSAHLEPGKSG